jgi:hypothetical protein
MVNRWRDLKEVSAFADELDYWKRSGLPLVLFGPMPEFQKFSDRMSELVGHGETREQAARSAHYDPRKLSQTSDALRSVARRNGLVYVDTAAAFCSLSGTDGCVPFAGHEYLLYDYAHLSLPGARLLGGAIASELRLQTAYSRWMVLPRA